MSKTEQGTIGSPEPLASKRRSGWLKLVLAGIAAAVLPKCLACLAGYLALASGLATVTPELCGAVTSEAAWSQGWLAVASVAFFIGVFTLLKWQCPRGIGDGENTKQPSS